MFHSTMALTTSPSAPTGSRSWSRTERADAVVELGRAGLHPLDHEADLDEVPGARSPVSKYGVHDSATNLVAALTFRVASSRETGSPPGYIHPVE